MFSLKRFFKSERGGVAAEGLIWLGTMALTSGVIVDAAGAFHSYSTILRALQDTNRMVSIGAIRVEADAETFIAQRLAGVFPEATPVAVIDTSNRVVVTGVGIPWTAMNFTGRLARFDSPNVTVTAVHMLEWN